MVGSGRNGKDKGKGRDTGKSSDKGEGKGKGKEKEKRDRSHSDEPRSDGSASSRRRPKRVHTTVLIDAPRNPVSHNPQHPHVAQQPSQVPTPYPQHGSRHPYLGWYQPEQVTRALGSLNPTAPSSHGIGMVPNQPQRPSDTSNFLDNYYDRPAFPTVGTNPYGRIQDAIQRRPQRTGFEPPGWEPHFEPVEFWHLRMAVVNNWTATEIAASLQRPVPSVLQQIEDFKLSWTLDEDNILRGLRAPVTRGSDIQEIKDQLRATHTDPMKYRFADEIRERFKVLQKGRTPGPQAENRQAAALLRPTAASASASSPARARAVNRGTGPPETSSMSSATNASQDHSDGNLSSGDFLIAGLNRDENPAVSPGSPSAPQPHATRKPSLNLPNGMIRTYKMTPDTNMYLKHALAEDKPYAEIIQTMFPDLDEQQDKQYLQSHAGRVGADWPQKHDAMLRILV
ncbi:hypothetical protein DHEL01_v205379 [Diaporthe helianthi]|uniref:Uncharacterized protein n=1 Tax=Diaporthe helianthi TaxID=158607 RepID=A0A2P5I135_DIAHE|nr:hypothetical protein DHEL01_v205379 [Diaporthe helianthi]